MRRREGCVSENKAWQRAARKKTEMPASRKPVPNRRGEKHLSRVSLELVILRVEAELLQVWLELKAGPSAGAEKWKLPGSLISSVPSLDAEARRKLKQRSGSRRLYMEQLYTFARRPLRRSPSTIAVTYLVLVDPGAGIGVERGRWFLPAKLPALSPGTAETVGYALARLRNKIQYTPAVFHLLPPQFSLSELQTTYERILGRSLDKRNFRKKFLSLNILASNGQTAPGRGRRPARLYSYLSNRGTGREKSFLLSFASA